MSEQAGDPRRFHGKYRGTVKNTLDPMQLGRVQVACPAVLGEGSLSWAMPCTPYAGNGVGLFLVPPVGANVWVEFEGGDTRLPILAGCFWGTGEVPASTAIARSRCSRPTRSRSSSATSRAAVGSPSRSAPRP